MRICHYVAGHICGAVILVGAPVQKFDTVVCDAGLLHRSDARPWLLMGRALQKLGETGTAYCLVARGRQYTSASSSATHADPAHHASRAHGGHGAGSTAGSTASSAAVQLAQLQMELLEAVALGGVAPSRARVQSMLPSGVAAGDASSARTSARASRVFVLSVRHGR